MDETDQNRLTEGSVPRKMLAFALPIFLSNLFQQLYNAVDSLIVGNFIGSTALAAVGSSASMIMLLVGFINGVSLGAGVVIARFYGADDRENLSRALHTTRSAGHRGRACAHRGGRSADPPDSALDGHTRRCHRKFHCVFSSVLSRLQRRSALQYVRQHPPVCGGQPQSHEVSDFRLPHQRGIGSVVRGRLPLGRGQRGSGHHPQPDPQRPPGFPQAHPHRAQLPPVLAAGTLSRRYASAGRLSGYSLRRSELGHLPGQRHRPGQHQRLRLGGHGGLRCLQQNRGLCLFAGLLLFHGPGHLCKPEHRGAAL